MPINKLSDKFLPAVAFIQGQVNQSYLTKRPEKKEDHVARHIYTSLFMHHRPITKRNIQPLLSITKTPNASRPYNATKKH